MPPTLQCDYGSVAWRLKATVHRPGPFTPKLTASRDVILVASPNEDDREDIDNVTIERCWEDQMQYMLTVSGRVFPIGGTVPITLTILPMAKVKIFGLTVHLEGRYIHPYFRLPITHVSRAGGLLCFFPHGMPQGSQTTSCASLPEV
jgi:arrestin-related trafficking adapter 3/6